MKIKRIYIEVYENDESDEVNIVEISPQEFMFAYKNNSLKLYIQAWLNAKHKILNVLNGNDND